MENLDAAMHLKSLPTHLHVRGEYTMEHRSRAYSVAEISSDESGPISSAGLIVSLDQ